MVAAEVQQRVALRAWGQSARFCRSLPPTFPLGSLTSRAHACIAPVMMAMAVLPAPRSTEGRFAPISARGEQEQA